MCSGAHGLTTTSPYWCAVKAADTCTCSCWPQMTENCCPPNNISAARFSLPTAAETLPVWGAVFANTLWAAWLLNRDNTSGTHTPCTLPVLLCSAAAAVAAAAEGKWWSRSLGGVPWPGTGHVVGMWGVLQDWGCLSTGEKQKKWERERRRGKHWAELPGKCCCGQFAWAPQGLLIAALISSPWDPGMICCHMRWAHCFLSKKKAGILRRDYIHAWAYLKVLGLFFGL